MDINDLVELLRGANITINIHNGSGDINIMPAQCCAVPPLPSPLLIVAYSEPAPAIDIPQEQNVIEQEPEPIVIDRSNWPRPYHIPLAERIGRHER